MKRLILALILLVVVLITGCADAGRRDQDKKSVHSPAVTLGIERIGEYEQLFAGKRVGLITNQTGVDSKLRSSEDILLAHTDLTGILCRSMVCSAPWLPETMWTALNTKV